MKKNKILLIVNKLKMSICINKNNKDFKSLAEMSGINPIVLAAKMGVWMEKNKTEEWPSLEQLGFEGINLEVKTPTEKATYFSNLFQELKNKFGGSEFSFGDARQDIQDRLSESQKYLLDFVASNFNKPVKLKLASTSDKLRYFKGNERASAIYNADNNTIYIDKIYFELNKDKSSNQEFTKMIMHELIHAGTVFSIKDLKIKASTGNAEAVSKLSEINEVFNQAKSELENTYPQYFKNLEEFFAGLSDNDFVSELNMIKKDNSSLIDRIISFLQKILGINPGTLAAAAFKNLFDISASNKDYTSTEGERIGSFTMSGDVNGLHETTQELIDRSEQMQKQMVEDANGNLVEGDKYINKTTSKLYNRITYGVKSLNRAFIPNKKKTKEISDEDYANEKADRAWGSLDHSFKLSIEGEYLTRDEYYQQLLIRSQKGKGRGNLGHKINELINVTSEADKNKILREIDEIATMYQIDKSTFDWMFSEISDEHKKESNGKFMYDKIFAKMYDVLGINKFNNGIPDDQRDRVLTEVQVFSDLLTNNDNEGYAGSVDMIVEHQESIFDEFGNDVGKYMSIYDLKSGYGILDSLGYKVLKFGEQEKWITNSSLDMAKLQIALYAFLIKLNNPNQRFKNLQVAMIQNKWQATIHNPESIVEVESYIPMIEAFFKDRESMRELGLSEDMYEKIIAKSKNIFDPSHYKHRSFNKSAVKTLVEVNNRLKLLEAEISKTQYTTADKEKKKEEMDELLKQKIMLENDSESAAHFLDQSNPEETPLIARYLGGIFDSKNRLVQAFGAAWNKAYNNYSKNALDKLTPFQKNIEDLRKEFKSKKNIIELASVDNIRMYEELLKRDIVDGIGETQRLILPSDVEWISLSEVQKKFINDYNAMMKSYFDEGSYLRSQASTDYAGKPISHLKLSNPDFKYYDGFFPKIAPSDLDLKHKHGGGNTFLGTFSKEYMKVFWAKRLDYLDENIVELWNNKSVGLPVKYLGNSNLHAREYFSYDLGEALAKFVDWVEYKENIDPIYAMGKATLYSLQAKARHARTPEEEAMYRNESKILEGFVKMRVQKINRTDLKLFGRKGIRIGNNFVNGEPLYFVPEKFLDGLSQWGRSTSIWANPKSATGNTVAQLWLIRRNALKDELSQKWFKGDINFQTDMDVKSFDFANKEFMNLAKDVLLGKLYENKLWKMMEKHNYINGDTVNAIRRISSTVMERTSINQVMMSLQSVSEFWTLSMSYATQMHHMKLKDGRSFYDAYELDENGDYSWTGGVRGKVMMHDGSRVELKELDAMEIKRLHRVHEKLFGSYRSFEFIGLEMYALGRFALVLKKYFPRVILNLFDPSRNDYFLGEYKKIQEITSEDGTIEDIYAWKGREVEAKFKAVGRLFTIPFHFLKGSGRDYMRTLTTEQKRNVIEIGLTYLNLAVMISLAGIMFADTPDEDIRKKWFRMYLIDNLAQQYNPVDIARSLSNMTPIGVKRAFTSIESAVTLGGAIISDESERYTRDGNIKGMVNLQKSIPFVSSYYEILRGINSIKTTEGQEKTENMLLDWFSRDRLR